MTTIVRVVDVRKKTTMQALRCIEEDRTPCRNSSKFCLSEIKKFSLGFTLVIYQKIYSEEYINNRYSCPRNNTTIQYFILGRVELRFNFSSVFMIFTYFQWCTWSRLTSFWIIHEYQIHPSVYWINSNVAHILETNVLINT